MRLFIPAGLSAMLFCSSCMAFEQKKEVPPAKATSLMRIESFATKLSTVLMDIPRDVLPVVKGMGEEVSADLRSDWPKIREELGSQVHHLMPGKKNRDARP